jgi:uncharacterized membrane protein HdeD (DUF308 family)
MATVPNTSDADLAVHEMSYHSFMLTVKWSAIHLAALIAFLALWFCTSAGFFAALVVGILAYVAGVFAMTHGLNHSSEPHPRTGR